MPATETLAILVLSDAHFDSVLQLATAAREGGKAVCVHLAEQGARLVLAAEFQRLTAVAQVSVCRPSYTALGTAAAAADVMEMLVPSGRLAELIAACDRQVVL